jgi:2-polyprenyl-6-methoxyphenol hydroxylase-like FAD-dependent oxidoreductase
VLLVDSKSFPRSKVCGASLNGQALAILRSVGLGELPQSLGGIAINQFDVRSNGCAVRLPLPEGVAVSRNRFDAAMVEQAIVAGAGFLPETTATLGQICENGHGESRDVWLRHRDRAPVQVRARVVLAADGLGHGSLRDHPEFCSRVTRQSRIGLGGQVADYPADYGPGTISMAVGRHGYVGLVRVEQGLLNVAAALAPDCLKGAGGAVQALASVLDEAGFPPIASLSAADWHGTLALSRRTARTAGRRVLLLGDAAGYVEPFTGEGMAWAFAAALAAPGFVARGLSSWDNQIERDWQQTLRRLVRRRQYWCQILALATRHPLAVRIVLGAVSCFPVFAKPIIGSINKPPKDVRSHA